jgi:hypothetical protein
VFSNTDELLSTYEKTFSELRADFLAGIEITTIKTALHLEELSKESHQTISNIHAVTSVTNSFTADIHQAVSQTHRTIERIGLNPFPNYITNWVANHDSTLASVVSNMTALPILPSLTPTAPANNCPSRTTHILQLRWVR